MALNLKIENETNLADGGPLGISVTGRRSIDIGRDTHLDWTLPDPTRFISSKHAEIRYKEGGYWLHDVSTNGIFLNGSDHRMQAPHRLRNGDRFVIGHYIIGVALDGDTADAGPPGLPGPPGPSGPQPASAYQEMWNNQPDIAPPIDRNALKAPRERNAPVNPDFLDWAADVPNADPFGASASPPMPPPTPPAHMRQAPAFEPVPPYQPPPPRWGDPPAPAPAPMARGDEWSDGPMTPGPPPPPAPPEIPQPRRPGWTNEPEAPWAAETPAAAPAPVAAPPFTPEPQPRRPPPVQPAASPPAPAMAGTASAAPQQFIGCLAAAAGVPEQLFTQQDPTHLADQIGTTLRLVVDNVMQLLNARVQAKRLARSSSHTLVQAFDNNPLKFSPTAEEAMRVMFGPPTKSYLDARRAMEQGFDDLKSHQIKTYSAMQHALTLLLADLDPQAIDRATDANAGIAALVTSRKAKLWDAYVARWQAQFRREGGGPVDSFMLLFADCYDRDSGEKR
jgi:type VI secretion system protein ImpI